MSAPANGGGRTLSAEDFAAKATERLVASVSVPVMAWRSATAWPKPANRVSVTLTPIAKALTTAYRTDAHFAAYCTTEPRRLNNAAIGHVPITMALLVGDVDDPVAHRLETPARDEWREVERRKVLDKLAERHPGLFSYLTRRGYRIVFRVAHPFEIRTKDDAKRWWALYESFRRYMRRSFDIVVDPACKDFGRLYRLPVVTRDGTLENLGSLGDANSIEVIDPTLFPAPKERHPFVAAAFKREVKAVRSAPNGQRNEVLNKAAFNLGGFVPSGHLDRDEVADALLAAIVANGGEPEKDARKINEAIDAGMDKPREPPKQGDGQPSSPGASRTRAPRAAGAAAPEVEGGAHSPEGDGRPQIHVGVELFVNVNEASSALQADPEVYTRDDRLVIVSAVTGDEVRESAIVKTDDGPRHSLVEGTPTIREMGVATLTERLTLVATFLRFNKKERGWVRTLPPDKLVSALRERGRWPRVRPIVAVVESPTMRPDGSIIQTRGYDVTTRCLYAPNDDFPQVMDRPSQKQACNAYAELVDLLSDFPHDDDQRDDRERLVEAGAHKAVPIAHAMTIVARHAIPGATPMFVYDANTRGSGKSLQTDFVSMLANGRPCPRMTYPSDDTELEKSLGAYALQGQTLFSLDNISRALGGAPLDRVLTATDTIQFRILGETRVLTLPWRAVAAGTGNNVSFAGDTCRRVLVSRLVSPEEAPEERTQFKYDLLDHVRANRARLVVALLTILRAYVTADRPDLGCKRWGSFEAWSRLIPHAIVFAGGQDPMKARPPSDVQVNPEVAAIVTLIARAPKVLPNAWTAAAALGLLLPEYPAQRSTHEDHVALREAVEQLCGRTPSAPALGRKLSAYRERWFRIEDGRSARLVNRSGHAGIAKWSIEVLDG